MDRRSLHLMSNSPSTTLAATRRWPVSALMPLCTTLCALIATPAWSARAEQESWQVESAERELAPGVLHAAWQLARGANAYERIAVHRYRSQRVASSDQTPSSILLYLPGTNMNGEPTGLAERYDLFTWLARRGVVVYAIDYRTNFVPADDQEVLEVLGNWKMGVFVDDALAALRFVEEQQSSTASAPPKFVAGFSRGAAFAYALACAAPDRGLAGVIALDGLFKSSEALGSTSPESLSAAYRDLEASGSFASDVAAGIGWQARSDLMQSVAQDPFAKATREGFPTIGQQLAELLYQAWGPGRLAHPLGSSSERGITRPEVLAQLLEGYDRYYPAVQNREGTAIAGVLDHPDVAFDDCFGDLDIPVLFFGSTGMGEQWLLDGTFSAVKAGPGRAEIHVLEGYGHLDVLVAETAERDVFEPLLRFLRSHAAE